MPTVYQFDYKGHPVRVIENRGEGYLLAPDIMALLGYEKPLTDFESIVKVEYGVDSTDLPTINSSILDALVWIEIQKNKNVKKAQKLKDWLYAVVFPAVQGQIVMPDDVILDWWEEEDCEHYLKKVKEGEEQGLYTRKSKKATLEHRINGKSVAKAKIKTEDCSIQEALASFLTSFIFMEIGDHPDCADALDVLHKINREVIATIQEHYLNWLEEEGY